MVKILIRNTESVAHTIRSLMGRIGGDFRNAAGMGEVVVRVKSSDVRYVEGMCDALGCYSREIVS